MLHFPYRSKVSFAFINQTNSNLKLSLRYKIKGYYKKIGFNVVAFWLSGGKSLNTKLTYKLGSNVDGFYENNYIEESGLEDYYNLLGLEIKL